MIWSGSVPQCSPVDCGDPGSPNNGIKNGAVFTFESVVTFACDNGYYLSESQGIVCEADMSWNSSVPQCIQINCGDPGSPMNGSATLRDEDYSYEAVVTFDCDEGFEISGSGAIVCGDNNQWELFCANL